MEVIYDKEFGMRVPLKVYGHISDYEQECINQMKIVCRLPHVFHHVTLMPDGHVGQGASIGSVVPLKGAIVVNLVGVDIGCGMTAYPTPFKFEGEYATKDFWRYWLDQIQRDIPSGFKHHTLETSHWDLGWDLSITNISEVAKSIIGSAPEPESIQFLSANILGLERRQEIGAQLGTLGGGNHFIEAQRDENNRIWIMIHSGSRNIGNKIASYYDKEASKLMKLWKSDTQENLNWIPLGTDLFISYMSDMNWAVSFALTNRLIMMTIALRALGLIIDKDKYINIPHNYASWENHFDHNVIIHRKGATRLRKGEIGIIPGSMGSNSYIVEGKGCNDSYNTSSHGAGRTMGRNQAKKVITESSYASSLKDTFTKASIDYIDEAPEAYKDIDEVIKAQSDILEVVHTLTPIITMKATD